MHSRLLSSNLTSPELPGLDINGNRGSFQQLWCQLTASSTPQHLHIKLVQSTIPLSFHHNTPIVIYESTINPASIIFLTANRLLVKVETVGYVSYITLVKGQVLEQLPQNPWRSYDLSQPDNFSWIAHWGCYQFKMYLNHTIHNKIQCKYVGLSCRFSFFCML